MYLLLYIWQEPSRKKYIKYIFCNIKKKISKKNVSVNSRIYAHQTVIVFSKLLSQICSHLDIFNCKNIIQFRTPYILLYETQF